MTEPFGEEIEENAQQNTSQETPPIAQTANNQNDPDVQRAEAAGSLEDLAKQNQDKLDPEKVARQMQGQYVRKTRQNDQERSQRIRKEKADERAQDQQRAIYNNRGQTGPNPADAKAR